jgi:malate dehydrogenase (oxaloacetate-decarboxylating)
MYIDPSLNGLDKLMPERFTNEQRARFKTLFYQKLSLEAHRFYGGKLQAAPKCGMFSPEWLNVWYTPGVSSVSTAIQGDADASFALTCRGNLAAVISGSPEPAGALGLMEGKAMLMKYLGGVDAVALCIDSRNAEGRHDPRKLIDFVTMIRPSFGAVALEHIGLADCAAVLGELQDACGIPVWHDEAQGAACVVLAGLINALNLAGKRMEDAKIVLLGADAAHAGAATLIAEAGGNGGNLILFDEKGALHTGRADLQNDPNACRNWELCRKTNLHGVSSIIEAVSGADALIALSMSGPAIVQQDWIRLMADQPIVFAHGNPEAAKRAGAFIAASACGGFPNHLANALCFPGIVKGALMARARKISDGMAVCCARSIAEYSRKQQKHFGPDHIIASSIEEIELFARAAADVAMQAVKEGLNRAPLSWNAAYEQASADISAARTLADDLQELGYIQEIPQETLAKVMAETLNEV